MELQLIDKTETTVSVGVKDPDMTIINPVLGKLMEDECVLDVEFTDVHPELENPIIKVTVDSGDPLQAFQRSTAALACEFRAAREGISGRF